MAASPQGLTGVVYYMMVYMFANIAAFGVAALVERQCGNTEISSYNGLYKTNPWLSVLMMFALFSLAGIPPFAGFFSKFFIFASAVQQGYYILVLIALLNTIISLYYYLLIVRAMFITPNDNPLPNFRSDNYSRIAMVVCFFGIVLSGIVSFFYNKFDKMAKESMEICELAMPKATDGTANGIATAAFDGQTAEAASGDASAATATTAMNATAPWPSTQE